MACCDDVFMKCSCYEFLILFSQWRNVTLCPRPPPPPPPPADCNLPPLSGAPGGGEGAEPPPPPPRNIFAKKQVKRPLFTNKEAVNRGILRCCNRPIQKLQLSDLLTFQTLSVAKLLDKSKYFSDADNILQFRIIIIA